MYCTVCERRNETRRELSSASRVAFVHSVCARELSTLIVSRGARTQWQLWNAVARTTSRGDSVSSSCEQLPGRLRWRPFTWGAPIARALPGAPRRRAQQCWPASLATGAARAPGARGEPGPSLPNVGIDMSHDLSAIGIGAWRSHYRQSRLIIDTCVAMRMPLFTRSIYWIANRRVRRFAVIQTRIIVRFRFSIRSSLSTDRQNA